MSIDNENGDLGSGLAQVLTGHNSDVTWCDFSSSKVLISASNDKTIRLWKLNDSGRFEENKRSPPTSPFIGHTYGVNCVRFSPFDTIVASCSTDGYIILWNAQTGQQVVKLRHVSECAVRVCAFSPSCAILASAGDDETICIWDISTRSLIRSLVGHEAMVTAVSFSPDSNYLISGSSGGDIKLWDARHGHGKCLDTVTEAHDLGVTSCDFSSQYQVKSIGGALKSFYILASCGNDDLVKIWHVQSGIRCSIVLSSVLEGHTGNINCCQFSQDGTLLASAAGDKSVIIWNPITAQMVHRLEGHNRYVTCCTFSADNCYLATGSNDKSLIVWSLDGRPNLVLKRKNSFLINFDTLNTNEGQLMSSGNAASGWSVDSVVSWITQLGLGQYEDVFRQHEIDGQELLHLTHDTLLTTMKVEALGHRNKLLRGVQGLRNPLWQHSSLNVDDDVSLPEELYCPITHEFMREPVVASDGYSYEKEAIKEWLTSGKMTSPMTNEPLADSKLIANKTLSLLIKKLNGDGERDVSSESPETEGSDV